MWLKQLLRGLDIHRDSTVKKRLFLEYMCLAGLYMLHAGGLVATDVRMLKFSVQNFTRYSNRLLERGGYRCNQDQDLSHVNV